MQNIVFKHLLVENFCGLKKFETDFYDRTIIKGANGVGKSTISNAISWCLADKMINGSAPDNIRPKNEDGTDIDFIDISVSLTMSVDDFEFTVQKVQRQNWILDKTTQNQRFKGNDNYFSVNDIPKKKADYEAFIAQYIDINYLLLCMTAYVFWSKDTKGRRSTLFGFKEDADEAVFEANDKFEVLRNELAVGTLEELIIREKKVISEKKKELAEIPPRIDELSKNMIEMSDGEIAETRIKLADAEKKLAECDEVAKTYDDLGRKIHEDGLKIQKIIADVEISNQQARAKSGMEEQALTQQIALLRGAIPQIESRIKEAKNRVSDHESMVKVYKNSIEEIKTETFNDADLRCPVCGSKYTKTKLSDLKAKWQDEQDKKILDNERQCQDCEIRIEEIKKNIAGWESEITAKQAEIEERKKMLSLVDKTEFVPLKAEDTDEYKEVAKDIEKCKQLQEKISLKSGEEKQVLLTVITDCKTKLNKLQTNNAFRTRIDELTQEQLKISQKIADAEKRLDLLQEFQRAKIDTVTAEINKYFDLIKWRFFRLQVNGDYAETCEGLVDGISIDKTLNHGHRLLANLDLCQAFQKKAGINVPIFLDDAESVDSWRVPDCKCQLIVLRRTDDKDLVVESLA